MNTDKLTTILGCILAAMVAVKPILDGSGYHLDSKTVMELLFAALSAIFAYATNKPNRSDDKGAAN